MSKIEKGSIVWYWDKRKEEWRRGKVFSVNRWGVHIVARNPRTTVYKHYYEPVVPASDLKPDCDEDTLQKRGWIRYNYKDEKRYELLKRLGFKV